jgi:hypothetical protein
LAAGHWLLRISLLGNVALIISILSIWYPSVLQTSASAIFFWEHDPTLALWSFYGLVIGLATLIATLAARSISNSATATYK